MKTNLLKGKMRENALTQDDVANKMGISLSRFNAKLNQRGGAELLLGELVEIKRILKLDTKQMDEIFFR